MLALNEPIVDVGSMSWLVVEDHITDEFMENFHNKNQDS